MKNAHLVRSAEERFRTASKAEIGEAAFGEEGAAAPPIEAQQVSSDIRKLNSPDEVRARIRAATEGTEIASAPFEERPSFDEVIISDGLDQAVAPRLAPRDVVGPALPEGVPELALERLIGTSDFVAISYLDLGLRVSRTVGRVTLYDEAQNELGSATGFMVSPHLLLTNNHVFPRAADAAPSIIEFNDQTNIRGKAVPSVFFGLRPDIFFATDEQLDFSLVAVNPTAQDGQSLQTYTWNVLSPDPYKALVGEFLTIIQHPKGRPKQVALRENQLKYMFDNFLQYTTDTEQGSSGSPVYNDQWNLVALHHSGVPKKDNNGHVLKTDGTVYREGVDSDDDIAWILNEGVRISKIIANLENQRASMDAAQQRLLDEMLAPGQNPYVFGDNFNLDPLEIKRQAADIPISTNARGSRADGVPSANQNGRSNKRSEAEGHNPGGSELTSATNATHTTDVTGGGPTMSGDGSAIWTIPIEVSIRVGQPQPTSVPEPRPQGHLRPKADVPTGGRGITASQARSGEQPELAQALRELERSSTRTYYDVSKDKQDAAQYYADMPARANEAALYDWLRNKLETTHAQRPRYAPAKELYPWVDLHENGKLTSIYSGKEFDAEEFIREDFAIDQLRAQMQESLRKRAVAGAGDFTEELDRLESTLLPYNCEHTVPQSWFSHNEPMKGDLHHLFACERKCNSFRNNSPYFDYPDYEEIVREACGKSEKQGFEPSANRAVVARAVLYFMLRYPHAINSLNAEYDGDSVKMLLNWHNGTPVSTYEQHRNQAIFERQGNRNPLIDHPELAAKIDFTKGL